MANFGRQTMFSLKYYFHNLNLFQPLPDGDEREDEQQRYFNIIVTRVYLVLLTSLVICLCLFIRSKLETTPFTLLNPCEEQLDDLPIDADCPCSRISLSYGEFVSLQPNLHDVCRSQFVSDRWIKAIFSGSNSTYFNLKDFRRFGSAQFQALAGFCNLSLSYLEQNVDSLKETTFISPQIRSRVSFQQEIQSTLAQFKQTVPRSFASQLEFVRRMITSNRLVSGLQTNFIISYGSPHALVNAATYDRTNDIACSCLLDFQCTSDAVIDSIFGAPTQYQSKNRTVIPGLASGCLPVNSILASTLECFYNQTCLNKLISSYPTKEPFAAMMVNNDSRFGPYTPVQTLVDNLMVEDWIINVNYTKYFNGCAPLSCTYPEEKQHSWVFVLTQLISLLGTLIMALRLIIPMIVRFVTDKLNNVQHPKVPYRILLRELKTTMIKSVIELNTFKYFPYNDRQLRYQRHATRLYVVLIIISVSILTLYNLVLELTHRPTISNPSELEYIHLEKDYSGDLTCSCSSLSMSYSSFMTIEPYYHPLCSSYLITPEWIMYSDSMRNGDLYIMDYRNQASSQFQALAMLCEQAGTIIKDTLDDFLQTQVVGLQLMRRELFQTKMNRLIQDRKDFTVNQLKRRMELIQLTTSSNQLMNRLNIFFQYSFGGRKVINEPRHYDGCNCAYQKCYDTMRIYQENEDAVYSKELFTVPNFFLGCYPIEALLASTLECFYSQPCMEHLHSYFHSPLIESWTFPALNASLSSANETIQLLVDRLMVDTWSENVNFTSYYNKCAPSSCIIEYDGRYQLLTIVTIISGIFGGLSIGFQMLIWLGLRTIEKLRDGLSFRSFVHFIKQIFNWTDAEKLQNRLHIILVVVVLYTLYMHHAFRSQLITIETEKPELADYENLTRQHPDSLHCFCSQISIQYGYFLDIVPTFHPICSRDLIDEVSSILSTISLSDYMNYTAKYGYTGMGQLLTIQRLCKLSEDTVQESLNQLLASHFVHNQLLSQSSLGYHIRTIINDFEIRVPKTLVNTFALTRMTATANHLMNTYGTSWIFAVPPRAVPSHTAHTIPYVEQGCNCGLTPKCLKNLFRLKFGCYLIEAMWQSSLECLYDRHCIDKTNTTTPLDNSANPSRFPINSTFGSVVNELMMEKLTDRLSYENYFEQCAPSLCIHSYLNESNLIEGITVLISLYGGVVIICQMVAVCLVKLLRRRLVEIMPTTD